MLIGDMLESHALHVNFLALPDYVGARSVVEMLPKYLTEVQRALRLKKLANNLMDLVSGRHTHPLCAEVGGFSHVPTRSQLEAMRKRLTDAIPDAEAQIELMGRLEGPRLARQSQYLAVKHMKEFPLHDGALCTDAGAQTPERDYQTLIKERNVPYSHAKFSEIGGKSFFVGSLARLNVAGTQLLDRARAMAKEVGLRLPDYDTYHNNLAQAVEYLHYLEHAIQVIDTLRQKELKAGVVDFKIRAGTGTAAVEAPRGVLIHRYSIDASGRVTGADVITPTAMNYANIEADAQALVPQLTSLSKEEAELRVNMLLRAYDPCISCSVHFVRVEA
jgi:coenzyme F420-reducing hydrogenase alpha subunit